MNGIQYHSTTATSSSSFQKKKENKFFLASFMNKFQGVFNVFQKHFIFFKKKFFFISASSSFTKLIFDENYCHFIPINIVNVAQVE